MSFPRMRTATQLAADYKGRDPDTAVNVHFIRKLIATGYIPYVRAGKRFLINADAVDDYLTAGESLLDRANESSKIRRTDV